MRSKSFFNSLLELGLWELEHRDYGSGNTLMGIRERSKRDKRGLGLRGFGVEVIKTKRL
mgnify:CR=1 FL=1